MNDSTLKSVVVLDTETQWYRPVAHNLSASQAVDVVTEHTAEGRTVKMIDQEKNHRVAHAEKCKPCKEAALRITDDSAIHAPDSATASQE